MPTTHGFDGLGRATSDTVAGVGVTSHTFDAQGSETSTTGSDGVVTDRTFSKTNWLLTEIVDPSGDALTTTHTYDKLGRGLTTTDPSSVSTTMTYDRSGRVLTTTAGIATTTTAYDRQGNQISTTDPTGSVTTTTYDPLDRAAVVIANDVASPTLPTQDVTTRTYYDAAGTTIAVLDPAGTTVRTLPNVRDQAKQTIANCTDSGTTPTSNPPACIGAGTSNATTNVVTTITYDGTGATLLTIVAQGTGAQATSETAYDAAGRAQAVKDPMGTITRTLYDTAGWVSLTIVNCTNTGTTVPTTGWERCAGTGTQDGTFNLTTSFGYDARGNQTSQTAPNGRLTTSVYDTADRLITRIDNDVASPTGPSQDVTTNYYFDNAGRQAAVRTPTPDGTTTVTVRYLYNDDGTLYREIHNCTDSGTTPPSNPGTCTGAGTSNDSVTNVVTEYAYDARHNRTKTIAPDPSATATGTGLIITRSAYDSSDRLCRVVQNSTQTDGQWAALADPCTTAISGTTTTNLSTRYAYDGNGNLTSMTDALGQTTTYAYDERGQAISTTDALGKTIVWANDDLGHRIRQENRSDPPFTNSIVWTYDGAGRILTRVADAITTTYTYDANGNKLTASDGTFTITSTYDRLDRVLTVDDEDAGTTADTTYTYSLTSPSWTDPTGTYSATLDKFDRATATNDPANTTDFTSTYGADGQPLTTTDPNGNSTAFAYDPLGRLTSKSTTASGPVNRALYAWAYNRAGQALSETSTITGDPSNGQIDFVYDPLARLTSSAVPGTTTTYGWDKVPNRTSVKVGAGTAATTTFNAANRPTSGANPTAAYTSDDDGRLTARPGQTMAWDDLGRLKEVRNAGGALLATYTYDPLDRLRMVDYGASVRTRFRYVGLTTSAAQLIDDAAGTVTRNIGNGWTGERLLDWTGTNSNMRIYGTNAHHDVTWLASSTGTVSQALRYDPWGNPRSTVPTGYTPFRFQGSFFDAVTDLSWVVTRWYAPALGTFISEDALLGEPNDPDSRNLYAYGDGDPVDTGDPDGRHKVLLSRPMTWRELATRYYNTSSVAQRLAWANGWLGSISAYVPRNGHIYTLPAAIGGRAHTVYGRDDPIRSHSGFVFGPPFLGNPWRDGYHAWMPRVLTACNNCFVTSDKSAYVSEPYGAGGWESSHGWEVTNFTLGWAEGDMLPILPWSHVLRAREDRYEHGSIMTAWISWSLGGAYSPGSCFVSRQCALGMTADLSITSGTRANSVGFRTLVNHEVPLRFRGPTSFERSIGAAPRDYGHTVVWIPRAWGRANRVSVTGHLQLSGEGGVAFGSQMSTSYSTSIYALYGRGD